MSARKFDSEIRIDPLDRWIFRDIEITQPQILKYFRQNLKQNENGIFIENVFGELSENGYLEVKGFPCHIVTVREEDGELYFVCDDDKVYKFPEFEIYQTKDDQLIGFQSHQDGIKFRFDWNSASHLAEYLEEEGERIYFILGDLKMELPIYEGEIEVSLPSSYD
jgi:hypothetical protein